MDLKFEDTNAITPAIAFKLRKNNITTVETPAMTSFSDLQEILKAMLLNYAKAFNLAIVTNQVSDNPQQIYYTQDPTVAKKPTGGNILAHNAETRIFLRKASKRNVRIAWIIDSSWLPPRECIFQITEAGITDLEDQP
ncbi:MAG: hypothetical protein DRO36_05785 [Candidatus Hecatellales archaeon]|nr:MAG: hypothetical protein DRO36_05785 [Candidatus Hecatellales archaeon]